MFCKNCGKELNDNQAICLACGIKVGEGANYCSSCGKRIDPNAAVCTNCGVAVVDKNTQGEKKKLVVLLLAIFFGGLGVHNFYLGYTKNAVIQLVVSIALCWTGIAPLAMEIWALIEGIKAYNGELLDANGNKLVE